MLDYKKVGLKSLKNSHIFPDITPDDIGYLLNQLPTVERQIRDRRLSPNIDRIWIPDFSDFLVRKLREYWK